MFDKLRWKSRASVEPSVNVASSTSSTLADSQKPNATSFYNLPSELRINIYELVAHDTKLSLFAARSRTQAPSLLFVSRQVLAEYRPILLSIAPVRVHVQNYDFRPLMRVVGSLYSSELKALRANPNLTIMLNLKDFNVTDRTSLASLRRWAVKRAEHLDRLPWSYKLVKSLPSRVHYTIAVAQLDRLERSMTAVRTLQKSVHESLVAEIEPIACLLLERCISWEAAISHVWQAGASEQICIE